jgi:hypothetical protein
MILEIKVAVEGEGDCIVVLYIGISKTNQDHGSRTHNGQKLRLGKRWQRIKLFPNN